LLKRTESKYLSRRDFLKVTGAGLVGVAFVGVAGCGGGAGEDGEQVQLIAGHQLAADTPFDQGLERFAELVEEKTDGQVTVQVQPNAQAGTEPEMFQAMQQGGAVDVGIIAPGSIGEFVPEASILSIPFLVISREQRDQVINGEPAQSVEQLIEEETGVHTMGYFGGGVRNMFFTQSAESIESIEGRLFRVQPSNILTDSFGAVGLEPTVVAYEELYNALQQGVVDGAENESVFILSQRFYEPAPNLLQTQHEVTIRPLMISGATLDRLPEDLRSAVLEAGAEASEYERRTEEEADDEALQTLQEEHGMTVVEPPDLQQAYEAVEPVWQSYAEQWGMQDVLQQIQDMRSE
jgi:tripartite ATP-independent transporter DctP family solute receptor